ncbi:hypothetical protein F3Y22_tig00110893pilonHSYRG00920 [Hibiscus syriacus]|uniref:Uncharacterized protein n=1 Tax=Hibiscus syriacus TaxID=106335 RepID=A0A6A2ZH25_HIBSY|nr:hypothetical protein F3Y22_tig00110893pilonHSYRG00920 [Hibiscus syriacus]
MSSLRAMREIACAMHVPTVGHPRLSERAMREHPKPSDRGHPTEAIRASYTRASEDKRNHARNRRECMATYKVARRAWRPMFGDMHDWPRSRSPKRHGDLRPTL